MYRHSEVVQECKGCQKHIVLKAPLLDLKTFMRQTVFKAPCACFLHFAHCCFCTVFSISEVKDRSGRRSSSQHLSFLSKENACRPLCLFVQHLSQSPPPNRLTINAHIADYISDGYLGGKHLNDSTNRHSTVTDSAPSVLPSLSHGCDCKFTFCHSRALPVPCRD